MSEALFDAPFGTFAWAEAQPKVAAQLEEWGYDANLIASEGVSLTHHRRWSGLRDEFGDKVYDRVAWDAPEHGEWIVSQIKACLEVTK